jgi:hypothetical protein
VIQASAVGEVMTANGFSLNSLSTGRALHEDKANFQRTLSRYRGPEIANDGKPIFLDIVYSSKHMGRGVDQLWLGIYRMICTNGLITGQNFFNFGIRHAGDTYQVLDAGIKLALAQRDKLTALIEKSRAITLSPDQYQVLYQSALNSLVPEHATNVRHSLGKVQRMDDAGDSAWLAFNRIQENATNGLITYQVENKDDNGMVIGRRNMAVRPVKANTARDTLLNQNLSDALESIVKAA